MKKAVFMLAVIGVCFGGGSPCVAHPVSFYVGKARTQNLAQERQWRALLHFHEKLFSKESTIDSDAFFLAKDGKKNPSAELDATIDAFFKPVDSAAPDTHARCLFPARFIWLDKQLNLSKDAALPAPDCALFKKFAKDLSVYQTTLVYTSAFFGNPSSLFGHTLLRLDKKQEKQDMPLLSHFMTYGALTGNDGGAAFVIRGVFGGYPGIFTVSPYYDAVNLYNNMENRDLWEYRLNMTPNQTDLLVAHLWEAGHNYADYYFFSENCSYLLAEMLDAAYPEQSVAESFYNPLFVSDYTIPVDVVRAFKSAHPDAITETTYRPSKQTKIKHAWAHFSDNEKRAFKKHVARAPRDPQAVLNDDALTPAQKAAVLETAFEYLHYQYLAEKIKLNELRADSVSLLKARTSIGDSAATPPLPRPKTSPDESHLSGAVVFAGGARNKDGYAEFSVRPALHRLTDSSEGMLPFSELNYMSAKIRRYPQADKFRLQDLSLLNIQSVPPAHPLFTPLNFSFALGTDSYWLPDREKEGYTGYINGGLGYSLPFVNDSSAVFASAHLYGRAGGYLTNSFMGGVGARIGVLTDFGAVRVLSAVERIFYTDKDAGIISYKAEASFSLTKKVALTAAFSFQDAHHRRDVRDIGGGIQIFF